ncbi:MAG: hypothetical protein ACRCZF_14895 [Gemmataceae bacterium]
MRGSIGLMLLSLVGCAELDLREFSDSFRRKPDLSPSREPALGAAARVDQIGRTIMAANPFTGGDITFQTVGADESAIFHRDAYGLFITDTLVNQCKSDEDLAAILCSELGVMIAERRNANRMGLADSFPDVPGGAASSELGGIPADQVRLAELAMAESKMVKPRAGSDKPAVTNPEIIAKELFHTAGYEPNNYSRVEPLLKQTTRDSDTVRQLTKPSGPPRWTK